MKYSRKSLQEMMNPLKCLAQKYPGKYFSIIALNILNQLCNFLVQIRVPKKYV